MSEKKPKLKREITFGILILLAINAIIGTGIFFVPAIAARVAGPASLLSWFLVAGIALFIAACFAELSSMYPRCGGVYEYTRQAFGPLVGFLTGWTGWIVANITIAMLVVGSFDYLGALMPIAFWQKIVLCLAVVLGINYVSYRGIRLSAKVLVTFAVITILSLWIILTWGAWYINIQNISPFFILPKVSIFIAMVYILETFFGWETITYLAEETKEPRKDIPRAMILGTAIVTFLVLGVVTVCLGVMPWQQLAGSARPLAEVAGWIMGGAGGRLMAALFFFNILGTAAAWIVVTPRLIFAMARDKLLPGSLSRVHCRYRTPYAAIAFQAALTSFILISGSYVFLLKVLLPLAVIMYGAVALSVTALRMTKPKAERRFWVPGGSWLPILVVGILVILLLNIEPDLILAGLLFIILGVPLYILMQFGRKEFARDFYSAFVKVGPLYDIYSHLIYSKATMRRVIAGLDLKGRILELDCKTALFIRGIERRLKGVELVGTDLALNTLKRARKKSCGAFVNADSGSLPFKSGGFDFVFCVGISPETTDIEAMVAEITRVLKRGGVARILSFGRAFGLFAPVLEIGQLEKLKSKYGYELELKTEQHLRTQYNYATLRKLG